MTADTGTERLATPGARCIRCGGRCASPWRALWMLPCNRQSAQRRGTLRLDRLAFRSQSIQLHKAVTIWGTLTQDWTCP